MTVKPPRKMSIVSVVIDLLIDLALIGMGLLIYYHFTIQPLAPVTISPALTELVGGLTNAVYIMAGLPLLIGVLSFLRLVWRIIQGMAGTLKKSDPSIK